MIYITVKQHRKPRQITWEDVILEKVPVNAYADEKSYSTATVTRKYEQVPHEVIDKINVDAMIDWLKKFNEDNSRLFEMEPENLFYHFKIPKKTGGFRPIDAPIPELKEAMRRFVSFIRDDFPPERILKAEASMIQMSVIRRMNPTGI